MSKEVQTPRLVLRMTKDLHHWLKWYALRHDTTMSRIVKDYLEELRREDTGSQYQFPGEVDRESP
jgi:hypothetical protein